MHNWFNWLLRLAVPRDDRFDIIGDLTEEYHRRIRPNHSWLGAEVWYIEQLLCVVGVAITDRISEGAGLKGRVTTDLRDAWRSIAVRRGSVLATMIVFALGIGLASAIFTLTDPYILRPLPYLHPAELAVIEVSSNDITPDASIPTLADWRARVDLFKSLAAVNVFGPTLRLSTSQGTIAFTSDHVTANFLDVLGIEAPRSGTWRQNASDSDISVLLTPRGRSVLRSSSAGPSAVFTGPEGATMRVAGSLRDGFLFLDGHGLSLFDVGPVVDVTWSADGSSKSVHGGLLFIARLQTGVTPNTVVRALAEPLPSGRRLDVHAEWLSDRVTRTVRPLALGAFGAGLLVLLVCGGNVANLFVARGTYRAREFATREALGASRADIARLWLMELFVLSFASVVVGLAFAWAALVAAARVIPPSYATFGEPTLTLRGVCAGVLAGLVVVAMCIVPASLTPHLTSRGLIGQRMAIGGRRLRILRPIFGAIQAAFAIVLAVGAAMLIQSYVNLVTQDVGYDPSAVTVHVNYPSTLRGATLVRSPSFASDVEQSIVRLRQIPGVKQTAVSMASYGMVVVNGERVMTRLHAVTPGLFETVGMSIAQGRVLTSEDADWRGVVVNGAFARAHWPDSSPVGRTIRYEASTEHQATVVGVVRNVFDLGLDQRPTPVVYSVWGPDVPGSAPDYFLRVTDDPSLYQEPIRRAVANVNPAAVVMQSDTIGGKLENSVRGRTFATLVLTLFCVAGGVVSVAGLIGIVTFVVARRTREITIRLAIGAGPAHIRRLVVREAITAALTGGVTGLLVGRWLSTWLKSLVYGLEAGNWATALISAALMLMIMVFASLIPAQRAVHLQPADALRVE